jgi:arsenate reductase
MLFVSDRRYSILFLCTGNSARSIMAEAIVNQDYGGRFHGYSAGSHPAGQVNQLVLEFLRSQDVETAGLRSKSWDEFGRPSAPPLDFVITVCDHAAGEVCPVWPGHPATAHWGVEDPAAHMARPDEATRVIRSVFETLRRRISALATLPLDSLAQVEVQHKLREIGRAA